MPISDRSISDKSISSIPSAAQKPTEGAGHACQKTTEIKTNVGACSCRHCGAFLQNSKRHVFVYECALWKPSKHHNSYPKANSRHHFFRFQGGNDAVVSIVCLRMLWCAVCLCCLVFDMKCHESYGRKSSKHFCDVFRNNSMRPHGGSFPWNHLKKTSRLAIMGAHQKNQCNGTVLMFVFARRSFPNIDHWEKGYHGTNFWGANQSNHFGGARSNGEQSNPPN